MSRSEERYLVQLIDDGVVGLTDFRLDFEPKGARKDYRDKLRTALRNYRLPQGQLLHAVLTSDDTDLRHDLENVLLYNVGQGAFSALDSCGLRLERSQRAPEEGYRYRAQYGPGHLADGFRYWRRGRSLAEWNQVHLGKGNAWDVWWALRGKLSLHGKLDIRDWFGVSVTIRARRPVKLAGAIKGILDGIISACVDFDGPQREEISSRLARVCGVTPEEVTNHLTVKDAPLGRGEVVSVYRENVKWNPPDHRCLAIELLRGEPTVADTILSGNLFQLVPN